MYRKIQSILVISLILLIGNVSFAQKRIVNYFLDDPNAWNETSNIIREIPTKVIVVNGLNGLGFNLIELTVGDEVTLIFIEAGKTEELKRTGFYYVEDKLLPGKNRVVSVITRNHGDRTRFHYEFKFQRKTNDITVKTYNNNRPVLESKYDGNMPVKDASDLSGIKLCEIEIIN